MKLISLLQDIKPYEILMIYICLLCVSETGRMTLKLGALLTINFPKKFIETTKFPERGQVIKTATESKKVYVPYKYFPDFTTQMFKIKFGKE